MRSANLFLLLLGPDWQKWAAVATILNAILFAVSLVYVALQLKALRHQLKEAQQSRQLEADQELIDRITEHIDLVRPLYLKFCDDGFALNLNTLSGEMRKRVHTLAHTFARVGALFQSGDFHESIVLHLHAGLCVRVWLVLEGYIKRERDRRKDPLWLSPIEYLIILSLKYRLSTPIGTITIYHPENPTICKTYSKDDLTRILKELESGRLLDLSAAV